MSLKLKRNGVFLAGLLVVALALVAAGCGGDDGGGAPEALPSSSCTAIEYEGDGNPDYLIASDLPLQGASRTQTLQINEAIRKVLADREYKAGDYNIGFQACDDATAQAGKWDSGKCSQNANAYAANDKVIGVIGTFNSGCAAIIIPVLNQAPDGGIAMVSPANTYPCLTVNLPGGCDATEPDKYYPSGTRNYARVAPADDYQGAAVAEYTKAKGVKKLYVLNDKEAYGLGVATTTRKAAEHLGIEVAGFEAWDPKAASYESLFKKIKGTGADAVFLGGLIDENGAQVIKDKVAVLGPNDGAVKLYAPDGFTTQQTIDDAGPASAGMYMSVAGVPIDEFSGTAQEFADSFEADYLEGGPDRPVRDLRRTGGADHARRDRGLGRHALRRDREDVRDRGHGRPARTRSTSTRTATPRTRRARSSASRSTSRPTSSRPSRPSRRLGRSSRRPAQPRGPSIADSERGGRALPSRRLRFRVARHGVRARPASSVIGVDLIGLALVGLVLLWLAVNFVKDPTEFINVGLIGLTNGAIYGVVALGYTLVYGILQLINFAHGDVFALSGLFASTVIVSVLGLDTDSSVPVIIGGLLLTLRRRDDRFRDLQRDDRARRLQAAAPRAAPRAADHGDRHLVHRPEHRARLLRRRLPLGAELHPDHGRHRHRRDHLHVEEDDGDHHRRAAAPRAHLVRTRRRSRARRCGQSPRTARRPR